ncbi:MAG: TonB-dependent receptor [Chitinophagales bacterium]|nr:TonB-dependent receptor [Chitinophagales bacterium]
MRIAMLAVPCMFAANITYAQKIIPEIHVSDTLLNEVIISGIHNSSPKATSLNLKAYSRALLEQKSPSNLSDALSNLPGVGQMTTGNAISKPVIRGLYGNRILVLLSGLRFDNQQWQDEHGLGLSQIGISSVELIRGPASILYGSDALGGVVNIIEEKPKKQGDLFDITTRLYSNSRGTLTDIGYSHRNRNTWWRLRGGYENHADYADGNNTRVLNSRNTGYYVKAGGGFTKINWQQENSYNFSYNKYGFIIDQLNLFFDKDSRWSRDMPGPHHVVMLNTFSSQNTIRLSASKLKVNVGVQSNKRMEDEGGGSISLNMHLLSLLENIKWEKQLNEKVLFVANHQFTYEHNTNLGKRILVPDADLLEGSVSGFLRFKFYKINIETGAGMSYKSISTYSTGRVNSSGEIQPFTVSRPIANGLAGFSYNPNSHTNIKYNISSGFRMGNLAELSSNGLHEGSYRYEIGNPNLKREQNINNDVSLEIKHNRWQAGIAGYYNRFFNYIYLAPTADSFVGFQIFRYKQQNAAIYGGEFMASYLVAKSIELKENLAITSGVLDLGGNLPFIPAYKNALSLVFTPVTKGAITNIRIEPAIEYYFAQNTPAMFELATPAYTLVNFYSSANADIFHRTFNLSLSCKNLLNNAYASHLSRIRYYGLLNQGINIIFSVTTNLYVQ